MQSTPHALLAADSPAPVRGADTPFIPVGPGLAIRPIHVLRDARGYVAVLRLDPGTRIPPHRHTGAVHAFDLGGERRLHTGRTVRAGDYVYEPPGTVDMWEAIGAEPTQVLIVVEGDVEYLDDAGEVTLRYGAALLEQTYRDHCRTHGLPVHDLVV